jgi:DNA invertase Pin-like site-specific DNA recombinase
MAKQPLAIALCRVSSTEQLENNSLNRQRAAVLDAAQQLGVIIPENYWLSGSVSSKRGTNLSRKDLQIAIELCKKDKRIKYLIVDEPDRFMRSIDEAAYFEVTFRQLGVTVWYASDPELNKGDLASKLLKFTKYLSAEGSNEERQTKSISGQTKALLEGRYPGSPKPGYKKGYVRAVQEIHPVRGPALRTVLKRLAAGLITPTQAVIEWNKSDFMSDGHSQYKIDKFEKIAINPFYAGIVEMDKQVKARCENGLHEPLITMAEHHELVRIFSKKKKYQTGPRKNGNPKYPLSNHVSCDLCVEKRIGRYVGYDHGNGKGNRVYEKYRCRGCGRYLTRAELHIQIVEQFKERKMCSDGIKELLKALNTVWDQKEGQALQDATRIKHKIEIINQAIANQVEAATDPSNSAIKVNILDSIAKKKDEVDTLEGELGKLAGTAEADRDQFLKFAFNFIENMGSRFLEISPDNRMRCKLLVFPAGFYLDANNIVYTPQISPLYGLETKKKDAEASNNSHLVRVRGL